MTVDVISISREDIRNYVVDLYEIANGCRATVDTSSLEPERICDGTTMMQNSQTKSGVLINKINIADLFPNTIDITQYKAPHGVLSVMQGDDADSFNNKHGKLLVSPEMDVLKSQTPFAVEDIKDFILFCRVYGFWELDIGSVTLIRYNGKLRIQVNQGNKLFHGFIEVTV
ncbi:hypothetical protein N1M2_87 [Klebsiella phage N1M2]|uniref:Uncharacterized protein n=1 Tax=Klebsiella phage N1M2 TaxID=2664939 RepID=A0A6B7ZEP2_9CAUD|nr:hypothetical protein PQB72_gp087 [Klebsiella phage N1M2]QGH71950.1 hypothetical protein N1M2_87 [Klebsiella phage N1M2]